MSDSAQNLQPAATSSPGGAPAAPRYLESDVRVISSNTSAESVVVEPVAEQSSPELPVVEQSVSPSLRSGKARPKLKHPPRPKPAEVEQLLAPALPPESALEANKPPKRKIKIPVGRKPAWYYLNPDGSRRLSNRQFGARVRRWLGPFPPVRTEKFPPVPVEPNRYTGVGRLEGTLEYRIGKRYGVLKVGDQVIPAVIPGRLRGLQKHKDYDESSKAQALTGFWVVYPSCLKVRRNKGKLTSVKLIAWYDDIARAEAKGKEFLTPNRFNFTGEVVYISKGSPSFFVLRIWRNLQKSPVEMAKAGLIEEKTEASHYDQHLTGRIPFADRGKVLSVVCRFSPKDGSVYMKSKEEVPCEVPVVEVKSHEQVKKERLEEEKARKARRREQNKAKKTRAKARKREELGLPPLPPSAPAAPPPSKKPILKKKTPVTDAPASSTEAITHPTVPHPLLPPPPPSKPLSVQVGKQLFQAKESVRIVDGKLWIDGTHVVDVAMVLVEEMPGSTVQIEAADQQRLEMPEGLAVLMLRG